MEFLFDTIVRPRLRTMLHLDTIRLHLLGTAASGTIHQFLMNWYTKPDRQYRKSVQLAGIHLGSRLGHSKYIHLDIYSSYR
jgi:hypothetical protein